MLRPGLLPGSKRTKKASHPAPFPSPLLATKGKQEYMIGIAQFSPEALSIGITLLVFPAAFIN
jgi:hypothetical protein